MGTLSEKKYLLFDLDGTVIASQRGIFNALDYTLKRLDIPEPDFQTKCRFIGPSIGASLIREFGFTPQQATDAVEIYREYYGEKGLFECDLYDGLKPLLKRLCEQGKRLAIATKKPEMFASKIISGLLPENYFEYICGSTPEDVGETKGYVLLNAIKRFGSPNKADVLMIGDTKYDCIGANEAGVDCLAVGYGYGSIEEMTEHGAVAAAKDMQELYTILTGECL